MTPAMNNALGQRRVMIVGLLRITLPNHTIRLCDGSIAVRWGDEVFTGRDGLYGTIGEVEAISEATGDTIPGMDMSLIPPSLEAAVQLCSPANQGSPVRMWLAVVDRDTGLIVPDPELLLAGEVDTMTLEQDAQVLEVQIAVASVFERLFEPDEGAGYSDSFHQSIWPGELGMANMTGTTINELWGPGDKPSAVTTVPPFPVRGVQQYF